MMRHSKTTIVAAAGIGALFGLAAAAHAAQSIPKDWNWELKDGKPVRKAKVEVAPDGTKREVTPLGNGCVKIKEWKADSVKTWNECPNSE